MSRTKEAQQIRDAIISDEAINELLPSSNLYQGRGDGDGGWWDKWLVAKPPEKVVLLQSQEEPVPLGQDSGKLGNSRENDVPTSLRTSSEKLSPHLSQYGAIFADKSSHYKGIRQGHARHRSRPASATLGHEQPLSLPLDGQVPTAMNTKNNSLQVCESCWNNVSTLWCASECRAGFCTLCWDRVHARPKLREHTRVIIYGRIPLHGSYDELRKTTDPGYTPKQQQVGRHARVRFFGDFHRLGARNTTVAEDGAELEDLTLGEEARPAGDRDGEVRVLAQCHDAYLSECKALSLTPEPTPLRRVDPKLECMDISYCGLGDSRGQAVARGLPKLPKVTNLKVAHNRLSDKCCAMLVEGIGKAIHFLDLSHNAVGSVTLEVLARMLARRNALVRLELSGVGLADPGAELLADALSSAGTGVTHLNVSHNKIGVAGGVAFGSMLKRQCTLRHIDLSWNALRYSGADAVAAALIYNPFLTRLNVAWNSFGPTGCTTLACGLRENQTLLQLDLSSNGVDQAACQRIAAALG